MFFLSPPRERVEVRRNVPPYPPGALHPPAQRAGERIMPNTFLAGRQRSAVPQFLLPPGEGTQFH